MKESMFAGWSPESISSIGIIFFIIFGSYALFVQGRKIWKNESGLSVSVVWTFIFFSMFTTYPIIGIERDNILMVIQGVFRIIFYIPILCGLYKFKGFTRTEIVLARLFFVMVFIMIEYPRTGEFVYTTITLFGVAGVFAQGMLIKKEMNAGVVSAVLLFAYATNAGLWIWYNYEIQDFFLFINSIFFMIAYAYTIAMWIKFHRPKTA